MILFLPSVLPMSPFDKAIAGIESVFSPDMPIFGGASVDNMKGLNIYAFFDDQVVEKGWIAVGFADPTLKVITQVNHGFNVLKGMQLEVTRSESNIIYEFNGTTGLDISNKHAGSAGNSGSHGGPDFRYNGRRDPAELEKDYGSRYVLRSLLGNPKTTVLLTLQECKEGTNCCWPSGMKRGCSMEWIG